VDKKMLEKVQLRLYLRMQIRRIREILELQRLQALCKMRILANKIFANFDIGLRLEDMSYNEQMNYLITTLSVQFNFILHDLNLGWEGYAKAVGISL